MVDRSQGACRGGGWAPLVRAARSRAGVVGGGCGQAGGGALAALQVHEREDVDAGPGHGRVGWAFV